MKVYVYFLLELKANYMGSPFIWPPCNHLRYCRVDCKRITGSAEKIVGKSKNPQIKNKNGKCKCRIRALWVLWVNAHIGYICHHDFFILLPLYILQLKVTLLIFILRMDLSRLSLVLIKYLNHHTTLTF